MRKLLIDEPLQSFSLDHLLFSLRAQLFFPLGLAALMCSAVLGRRRNSTQSKSQEIETTRTPMLQRILRL